jgi:hypothetical protein
MEDAKLQLQATDVIDMVLIFGNTMFDIICKLTVDEDLRAINPHGNIHPSLEMLGSALKWM